MGRRENFQATLDHVKPEGLILDLGGCPLSSMDRPVMAKLLDLLGYHDLKPEKLYDDGMERLDERILHYLDIDTRGVGTILKPQKSQYQRLSDTEYIDEWGIKRKCTGLYWDIVESPLRGAGVEDLERYPWPDPESIDMNQIEGFQRAAKQLYDTTDYVICGEHPVFGIFELGCWMCGFDDFLLKMALDQDFVKRFFEIILEYQKKVIEKYYGLIGPYIHYTSSGDDFATQTSTFISVKMFRELIKPYFTERIAYTRQFTKASFLHHSCGSVSTLIPDLVEAGVEILNPIQPTGSQDMSPDRLKSKFGDRICFHGGLDTQYILPNGGAKEVKEAVRKLIQSLGKNGGYIFAAAHNLQEDVPPENIVTAFKAARELYK